MTKHSIPLGRLFGIPIGLDYSWFLIFGLMTWTLAIGYYPNEFQGWSSTVYWLLGAITAILLFGSVLLHELGHSLVALYYKIPVRRITLFIFGGVAQIGAESPTASAEFFIAIAGPVVSFLLGILFSLLKPWLHNFPPAFALFKYLAFLNLGLAIFNLIPGFPLDGGRVLRAILWGVTQSMRKATIMAANVGRFIAFLFIFFGVWQILIGHFLNGLWIVFIGWFLDGAASAQIQQLFVQRLLSGHTVAQAMNPNYISIPYDISIQELIEQHIFGHGKRCFIVQKNGQAMGFITLHHIKNVPSNLRHSTTAEKVMTSLKEVKAVTPQTELQAALDFMDRDGVNQLPVISDSKVLGMLSREDVVSYLRMLQELEG